MANYVLHLVYHPKNLKNENVESELDEHAETDSVNV